MSENSKIIQSITAVYARLAEQKLTDGGISISARDGNGFFMTAPNAGSYSLTEKDVIFVELADAANKGEIAKILGEIYALKTKAGAVITASPPYLTRLSEFHMEIPPLLDDFAQIIGVTMKTAERNKLASALKSRNGCLLENNGAVVFGRTLDEAATALLVAEKTAKTYVLAHYIGNPAPISPFESKLMNFVYKVKYSKKNQKAIAAKEKE